MLLHFREVIWSATWMTHPQIISGGLLRFYLASYGFVYEVREWLASSEEPPAKIKVVNFEDSDHSDSHL